jgi:hypothetical protein
MSPSIPLGCTSHVSNLLCGQQPTAARVPENRAPSAAGQKSFDLLLQRGSLVLARAGSHPGGRRGPLSGVDLPLGRRPQSAARHPDLPSTVQLFCAAKSLYSITSSVTASSVAGTLIPRSFAALWLMTSSNRVGFCTGRLAGFSPLRMRSAYSARRRVMSALFGE